MRTTGLQGMQGELNGVGRETAKALQNCVMKRPQENVVVGRHRRLCRTCMKCPLERLLISSAFEV